MVNYTNAVDMIEMACYLNIGIFSATRLFLHKSGIEWTDDASTYISGTITLILLMAVLVYHVFSTFCPKSLKKCRQRGGRCDEIRIDSDEVIGHRTHKPTSTVVEAPQDMDDSQSAVIEDNEWDQRSCGTGEQSNLLHSPR